MYKQTCRENLATYSDYRSVITFISLQIIMGLLRLGIITIFLSDSLVSGYTAAAAFTILITQISFLFGLDGDEAFVHPGLFATPRVSNCRAGGLQKD